MRIESNKLLHAPRPECKTDHTVCTSCRKLFTRLERWLLMCCQIHCVCMLSEIHVLQCNRAHQKSCLQLTHPKARLRHLTEVSMQYFEINRPLQTFIQAARGVLFSPKDFFSNVPPAAFYSNALFFAAAIIFISSFVGVPFRSMSLLFLLPLTCALSLLGLLAWSSYMSWAVKTLAKARLTQANAFQISAYAATPLAFSFVPYIGAITGLWNLYLLWTALINRCKVQPGMAMVIIVVPAIIFAVSMVAAWTLAIKVFPQLTQI